MSDPAPSLSQDFRALRPRADGLTESAAALPVAVMAPRLQGLCEPSGRLDLSLWGAGRLGVLRFSPLNGPFVYEPNGVTAANGGLYTAQSAPVLLLRGAKALGFTPARKCAHWDTPGADAKTEKTQNGRRVTLDRGVLLTEQRGHDLLVSAGENTAEAESGLALEAGDIIAESRSYIKTCDRLPAADPLLRGMVLQGVHAALSSARKNADGAFAGLAAGLSYSAPARTYYRDGYWTLQALLLVAPELARAQIDVLAEGIRPDGEAPSAVILSGAQQARAWENLRRADAKYNQAHLRPGEWWSDHFDSPLFFVLACSDYAEGTGDETLLARHWPRIRAVFERYERFAREGDGLPRKPRHDRDWADNVFRAGYVAYDIGLWAGVLEAVAKYGAAHDKPLAARAAGLIPQTRAAAEKRLWREEAGWYADYADDGFSEDHLALDSLTLLRHGVADAQKARRVLDAARDMLQSRGNKTQPYGDWGVLCAFPPFKRRADLRSKTAFAYRYHNGADWPWLDGLYAGELLRRGRGGWRYPLLKWWETALARGWTSPVEYFSPPFGRGSLLQGWSALPAAVALKHAQAVLAGDPEA